MREALLTLDVVGGAAAAVPQLRWLASRNDIELVALARRLLDRVENRGKVEKEQR